MLCVNKWFKNQDRPFKCGECEKTFVRGAMFKRHVNIVHRNLWPVKPIDPKTCEKFEPVETSNIDDDEAMDNSEVNISCKKKK